jgi:hypothetical protein
MYCSSCGRAVPPGLSYCNQCGARLVGAKGDSVNKSSEVRAETLVFMMVALFVFGLGGIIGLMAALKYAFNQREDLGLIIAFTLMSFLIMLGVEGVFTWMLLGRKRSAKEVKDTGRLTEQVVTEPGDAKARLLPEPALSVTEHTTRTLETVDTERRT